jgi:hypothetical protein
MLEELLGLSLLHALEGHAGPFGDDGHDVFFADIDDRSWLLCARIRARRRSASWRSSPVTQMRGFFEVLLLDGPFFLHADLFDLGLDVLQFRRTSHRTDAGLRAGFVHDVDGFVRQEAGGQIAGAEGHGRRMASSL